MKYILSPYNDADFNKYVLTLIKRELKCKAAPYVIENETIYELDGKKFTPNDIINSLILFSNKIYFSNNKLVNYAVYDLSQRFWYDTLNTANNIIRKLYFQYRRDH